MELAPYVGPTRRLRDTAGVVQPVEPGIAVGLQHAGEPGQVRLGVLASAVGGIAVAHRRCRRPAIGALVAQICPQSAGAGLAGSGRQHRHWRVIGMQAGASHDMVLQRVHQRAEQRRTLPDPIGKGGALELDPFAGVDL